MSTLMDFGTGDDSTIEDDECPHGNRTMDEDILLCFPCYMAQFDGTSFTMEPTA